MPRNHGAGYHEIEQYYENLIRTGQLAPGEMLPTEMELSLKHRVTRTTIRRAFEGLVNKGLVSRQQGRGTFVATAADVATRGRSHVLVVVPEPVSTSPSGETYVRENEGLYRYLESFTLALARYARPFRICFFDVKSERLSDVCSTAREDGAIGIIAFDVDRENLVDLLLASKLPAVFVDCISFGRPIDLVRADNFEGSKRATRCVLQTTPGPLAFIGGMSSRKEGSPHKERLDGFIAAHAEAGREVREEYIMLASVEREFGRHAVSVMSQLPAPPTGYVCSDDDLAFGVIEELRSQGIRVPGRVSVFGFGNSLYSRTTVPSLSTVAMDRQTMGLRAVEVLHERFVTPTAPPKVVTVPVQVLLRQTTIVKAPEGPPQSSAT